MSKLEATEANHNIDKVTPWHRAFRYFNNLILSYEVTMTRFNILADFSLLDFLMLVFFLLFSLHLLSMLTTKLYKYDLRYALLTTQLVEHFVQGLC